jgi:acetyl-CoA acyltransferase
MTTWSESGWRTVTVDEHPRPGTTLEDLAKLRPVFREGGRVTAGNSAGLNDGAGCVLLASRETAAELGLQPRMRLVDYTFVGVEPETMGYGPIPATEKLFAKTGLSMDDIDAVEMNEAFAVQCVAFLNHFDLPLDSTKVNPYGGAIALGHPLAMSGARLAMQLAYRMEREDIRYGITTLCVGLGMGSTVLWERVS